MTTLRTITAITLARRRRLENEMAAAQAAVTEAADKLAALD